MARVLVVEDDRDFREITAFLLQQAGYEVMAAGDGAAGLAQVRMVQPDVVLLDLHMPVLDGRGFLAARQAEPALLAVPVIITTADVAAAEALCAAYSVKAYLPKPFSHTRLLALLAEVVPLVR